MQSFLLLHPFTIGDDENKSLAVFHKLYLVIK
jgi:hypothetical protein